MAQTKAQLIDGKGEVDLGALSINGSAPDNSVNLDASGRLLVGTSTNNATFNSRLQVKSDNSTAGGIVIDHYENDTTGGIVFLAKSRSATVGTMTVVQNGDTLGQVQFYGADGTQHRQGASIAAVVDGAPGAADMPSRLVFSTTKDGQASPTEACRIDSAQRVQIGTTTATQSGADRQFAVVSTGYPGIFRSSGASAGTETLCVHNDAASGDNVFLNFKTDGTNGNTRGTIDYNRAGGLTRYNTTSDYRAKDIIGPVSNPGQTIDGLKIYEALMKGATQSRPMLVAHEAQQYVPYAVSGEKDETYPDGTPKYQQVDVSSLVPLLIAEIQQLRARVAALESA